MNLFAYQNFLSQIWMLYNVAYSHLFNRSCFLEKWRGIDYGAENLTFLFLLVTWIGSVSGPIQGYSYNYLVIFPHSVWVYLGKSKYKVEKNYPAKDQSQPRGYCACKLIVRYTTCPAWPRWLLNYEYIIAYLRIELISGWVLKPKKCCSIWLFQEYQFNHPAARRRWHVEKTCSH